MTNYNDGKWHRWEGPTGELPKGVHPMSTVEHLWHDEVRRASGITLGTAETRGWGQTLKFRVVVVHKEPREFWVFRSFVFESLEEVEDFFRGWEKSWPEEAENEIIHVREVVT